MHASGHFSSEYMKLLSAIHTAGGVPCESYPNLWFPEDIPSPGARRNAELIAKELCDTCPVKQQCFEYALETHQEYGIWGGTTPDER
jgi:hypothetical protein